MTYTRHAGHGRVRARFVDGPWDGRVRRLAHVPPELTVKDAGGRYVRRLRSFAENGYTYQWEPRAD